MRKLLIDVETTGIQRSEGHRILEFCAVEMVDEKLTGKVCHFLLDPEREIPEVVTKIHGITNDMVKECPRFKDVGIEIFAFMHEPGTVWIMHNAQFDLGFLEMEFEKMGVIIQSAKYPVICTLKKARDLFPKQPANLDALCDRFRIDRSGRELHGAHKDCLLLAEVYTNLQRTFN